MTPEPISPRLEPIRRAMTPFVRFFEDSAWSTRRHTPDACDFVWGNPHDMPLPGYVEAISDAAVPRDPSWFAYKSSEPVACETVAASLHERFGVPFQPADVLMTKGASSALAIVLQTVVSPGDEVVFVSPPWFFYEAMILAAGAVPVRVRADLTTFDLDLEAIAEALSPRTRAIIVNSPNNPTGRIYPHQTLARLAELLEEASHANRRPVYLLSDEAYNRIVFDEAAFVSPTTLYPSSFLLYSYGKTLLTPGQRLGYIALPPAMPERASMRSALVLTQLVGYGWPDAVLQHAMPELERLSIDVEHLQRRRDRMAGALRDQGYDVHLPEGTFYLLPRSPDPDDDAFAELLAAADVFVLPGRVVEMPGYFRISLTASDDMIERALPRFAAALAQARPVVG
jgi:aspartate aminotransferase